MSVAVSRSFDEPEEREMLGERDAKGRCIFIGWER